MHQRGPIRKYLRALLREKIPQVANKVWNGRPSARFLEMLPCIVISYGPETTEIISGDEKSPKLYERKFRLNLDILTRDTADDTADDWDPETNDSAEDEADEIAGEVEKVLADDSTLGRMLADWDPEEGDGLSLGLRIISTDPYNIPGNVEPRALVQRLTIEVPYETPALIDKKYKSFREYRVDINKPLYNDPATPEPHTLLSAEGRF